MTINLHGVHTIHVEPGENGTADRITIEHDEGKVELVLFTRLSRGSIIKRAQTLRAEEPEVA